MARQASAFQVLLFDAPADDVVATLDKFGAIRSRGMWWQPSVEEPLPSILISLHVRSDEDTARLGLGMSIPDYYFEADLSLRPSNSHIPSQEHKSMLDAAAIINIFATEQTAALTEVPRMIQRILSVHDGVAYDESHVWTSDDVRAGRMEGFEA